MNDKEIMGRCIPFAGVSVRLEQTRRRQAKVSLDAPSIFWPMLAYFRLYLDTALLGALQNSPKLFLANSNRLYVVLVLLLLPLGMNYAGL